MRGAQMVVGAHRRLNLVAHTIDGPSRLVAIDTPRPIPDMDDYLSKVEEVAMNPMADAAPAIDRFETYTEPKAVTKLALAIQVRGRPIR